MIPPISFTPLYKQRIWGGRQLQEVYKRFLPSQGIPYGESWELCDRPDDQSIVSSGQWKGHSLHTLWNEHREEIFGKGLPDVPRFPLLIKILDAQSDLSVQVHPPAAIASHLKGEPKTEMWYIARAKQHAKLYVGLRKNTTKKLFEKALHDGDCTPLLHSIYPQEGQSIFIPSGRLHAIGAGLLIHEIQQNSDTTYRVFDWNRKGLDGLPRPLHIDQSLDCIDFDDWEPRMDSPQASQQGTLLASCPFFTVKKHQFPSKHLFTPIQPSHFSIIHMLDGVCIDCQLQTYQPGDVFLLPAGNCPLQTQGQTMFLETRITGF